MKTVDAFAELKQLADRVARLEKATDYRVTTKPQGPFCLGSFRASAFIGRKRF